MFAARIGEALDIPVTELDRCFWKEGLVPTPPDEWVVRQQELAAGPRWILDGDLGPYDTVHVRLSAADTVFLLDFSRLRCSWRALRRSSQRIDFWRWLWTWHRTYRPILLAAVAADAPNATLRVFKSPRELDRFLATLQRARGSDR